MIKQFIKKTISRYSYLHLLYIKYVYLKHNIKLKIIFNKIDVKNTDIRTLSELKNEATAKIESKRSKVAHVIGSGWSLNKTLDIIGQNDFVIGFNFSPLAKINHDIYFIEFGGEEVSDTSVFHRMLADEIVLPSEGHVYFKNVWQERNDVSYIKRHIKGKYPLVMDFLVPSLDVKNIRQSLEFCLNNESSSLSQMCSTAISSVFLAYYFGFKKIVLHGIDFGGGYFFEQNDFNGYKTYLDSDRNCMYNKELQANNGKHPTALRKISIELILPILKDILSKEGVSLYTSSTISPSSQILPVYSQSPVWSTGAKGD